MKTLLKIITLTVHFLLTIYNTTIIKIINYLSESNITHKKLLTTPESFSKIIEAFENQGIDFQSEYFLLFDECHKLSKDGHFRKTITLPLNYFFGFDRKAFISATALIPRDPRFKNNGFEILNIVPTYDISHKVKIYKTNNASTLVKELIGKNYFNKKYFIFCNSINLITHTINSINISKESSIFCSETSADRLRSNKLQSIFHKLDESKFSTYNFFTSRFFSAIDINIDEDIEIILMTDLFIAEHTIIDPATDAIQIIGRFRNKTSKKNVSIVSTEDVDIINLNEESCLKVIECNKATYDSIKLFSETLPDNEGKQIIQELQGFLDYNQFLKKNGNLDYFIVDNYINMNSVKHLYADFNRLHDSYTNLKITNTDSTLFKVLEKREINYKIPSYSQKLMITRGKKYRTIIKEIVTNLNSLKRENEYEISCFDEIKESYKRLYYDIVIAYDVMDHNELLIIENPIDLKKRLIEIINNKITTSFPFLKQIQATFIIGELIDSTEALIRFKKLIFENDLTLRPTINKLKEFLILRRRHIPDIGWGYCVAGYVNNQ